jgi:hypothetical protein
MPDGIRGSYGTYELASVLLLKYCCRCAQQAGLVASGREPHPRCAQGAEVQHSRESLLDLSGKRIVALHQATA